MSKHLYTVLFLLMIISAGYLYFLAPEPAEGAVFLVSAVVATGIAVGYSLWTDQGFWEAVAELGGLAGMGITELLSGLLALIYELVVKIFSLATSLLEKSLEFTIYNFSQVVEELEVINTGWTALRDLSNILFIFILLYIAVKTILKTTTLETRQLVPRVIIVALLVNFSLFFSQAVIDVSNSLTVTFINNTATEQIVNGETVLVAGPSNAILQGLKLESLMEEVEDADVGSGQATAIYFFGIVFLSILTFVFGALAFLFLARFVMLIMYMIASPAGFLGFILPQTQSIANKWWDGLIRHAFWAPASMFMVWLIFLMTNPVNGPSPLHQATGAGTGGGSLAGAVLGGSVDDLAVLFNFFLLIAFAVAILVVPQKIGATGANTAVAWGRGISRYTGKKVKGWTGYGAGMLGRRTVGRAGKWAEEKVKKSKYGYEGGLLRKSTQAVAGAKFGTAMSAEDVMKQKKELKRQKDIQGKKLQLQKTLDDPNRTDEEKTNLLQKATKEEIEGLTAEQLREHADKLPQKILDIIEKSDEFTEQELEKIKEERYQGIREAIDNNDSGKMKEELKKFGDKELTQFSNDTLSSEAFGNALSGSQLDKLMSDGSITPATKGKIKENYEKVFKEAQEEAVNERVGGMKPEDYAGLSAESMESSGDMIVKRQGVPDLAGMYSKISKKQMEVMNRKLKDNFNDLSESVKEYVTTGAGKDIYDVGPELRREMEKEKRKKEKEIEKEIDGEDEEEE